MFTMRNYSKSNFITIIDGYHIVNDICKSN